MIRKERIQKREDRSVQAKRPCGENQTEEEQQDSEWEKGYQKGVRKGILLAVLFFFVLLGSIKAVEYGRQKKSAEKNPGVQILTAQKTKNKLKEVQNYLSENYLFEIDEEELSDYMFKGIAAGLDDKYAAYYSKEELKEVQASSKGVYSGVGITVLQDAQQERILVTAVYEDSPAESAGIQEGDELLACNDIVLKGKELEDAVNEIKKQKGRFLLTVYREKTNEELEFEMQCETIEKTTVESEILEDGTGYMIIREFDAVTVKQFKEAMEQMQEKGAERIIFDVRNNPGGLLLSVCDILDEILPEGLLVYTEDKEGKKEEYHSYNSHEAEGNFAVLVNEYSASAAEIFAGALQDRGRAVIIGKKTYGKGVVQNTFQLSDGSALKFTVQNYYTPSGKQINGEGIMPDYIVEQEEGQEEDPALQKAMEVLKENGK